MKKEFLTTRTRKAVDRVEPSNLSLLAATRWGRNLARSVEHGLGDARAALGDPHVQAHTRALLSELTGASRRARKIGLTKAFDDQLVAKRLSRASRHASKALDAARGRRRRNVWWRTLAVTGAAGLTAASAYAGWRVAAEKRTAS